MISCPFVMLINQLPGCPKPTVRSQDPSGFFANATPDQKYCTDCHGMHRKEKRTRRWDKEKRIIIEFDGRAVKPGEIIKRSADSEDSMM